jgi:chromosome segregation ATPase
MKKIYFIAPLFALIVFICVYSVHQSGFKKRESEKAQKAAAALQAKNTAEQEARKAAMADAIAAAELRKAEKAAKDAKDIADKEARQLAIDARDKAYRDQEKAAKQLDRLKKDIEAEQAAITKLGTQRAEAESEKRFLTDFVGKAQANVQALQSLLAKLNTPPAPAAAAK